MANENMEDVNNIRIQKYSEWLQANPDHPRYNEVYQNYQKLVTPTTGQMLVKSWLVQVKLLLL